MAFRIKDLMISEVGASRGGCTKETAVTCIKETATGCVTVTSTTRQCGGTPVLCVKQTATTGYGGVGCETATPVTCVTATATGVIATPVTWVIATLTICRTATPVTTIGYTMTMGLCAIPSIPGTAAAEPAGDPATALEQLAELKAQLKEAIAQIEREEAALESCEKPKTADEVESLQQKLRDAVDELENLKKELREKGK